MSDPYVEVEYYKDEYEGITVAETDFPRFAKRASDVVNILTEYLIVKIGMDNLADHVQELIKKATCAQIEYYQLEGYDSDVTGNSRSSENVSIGSFSYGGGSGQTNANRQKNRVSPSCLAYLEVTGLLRKRGVHIGVI